MLVFLCGSLINSLNKTNGIKRWAKNPVMKSYQEKYYVKLILYNDRGLGQLRLVSARLGPAQQARLSWASLPLAQAYSAHLELARHGLGGVWLLLAQRVESALTAAEPGRVGTGQVGPEAWPGRQSDNCVD